MIGIVLEFLQWGTGYRTLSYLDMLANGIGLFLGWLMAGTRLSLMLLNMERILDLNPVH